jgi:hypothetical protein
VLGIVNTGGPPDPDGMGKGNCGGNTVCGGGGADDDPFGAALALGLG